MYIYTELVIYTLKRHTAYYIKVFLWKNLPICVCVVTDCLWGELSVWIKPRFCVSRVYWTRMSVGGGRNLVRYIVSLTTPPHPLCPKHTHQTYGSTAADASISEHNCSASPHPQTTLSNDPTYTCMMVYPTILPFSRLPHSTQKTPPTGSYIFVNVNVCRVGRGSERGECAHNTRLKIIYFVLLKLCFFVPHPFQHTATTNTRRESSRQNVWNRQWVIWGWGGWNMYEIAVGTGQGPIYAESV